MSRLTLVLRELHRSETSLARNLHSLADRHPAEHEIHHVARDLARWSQDHVHQIAETGRSHGARLNPAPRCAPTATGAITRHLSSIWAGRTGPGLPLLADLRRVHQKAAGVSLDWELLAQAAQAMTLADLTQLAQRCHPDTLRQMRWTNAQLKVVSPQIIAA